MHTLIVANGDLEIDDWFRAQVDTADHIIAADGGTRYLHAINRPPNFFVGDGDSLTHDMSNWLTTHAVPRYMYPADKDETDLELTLLAAVDHEPNGKITVIGTRGGRIDQELANYLLLAHPKLIGHEVTYLAPHQRTFLIRNQTTIHGNIGDTISLIPIGGDVHVAHTTGLKWPLHNSTLSFGPARGISNVLVDRTSAVAITAGLLLCIHIDKTWGR